MYIKMNKTTQSKFTNFLNIFLFYASIIALSLGQIVRYEFSSKVIYLNDVLISLFIFLNIKQLKIIYKKILNRINKNIKIKLILKYLFFITFVLFLRHHPNLTQLLYILRFIFYVNFIFLAYFFKKNHILNVLIISGLITVIFGLFMYVTNPDQRNLIFFGWDPHFYRLIGPLLDPNFTGLLNVLFIYNLFYIQKQKKFYWLSLFLASYAIGLSFSRSTYLSLFISSLVFLKFNKQKLKNFLFIYFTIILALVLAKKPKSEAMNLIRTSTAISRINTSKKIAKKMDIIDVFIGKGPFYIDSSVANTNKHAKLPDNLILLIVNFYGLVGLFIFYYFLKLFFKFLLKTKKYIYLSIFIAVLIHSMFNNSMLEIHVFVYNFLSFFL